jgi:23S rRNA (guanosine2251-2'-O)-methyltransferase
VKLPENTSAEELQAWLSASGFTRVHRQGEVVDVVADRFRLQSVEQPRAMEAIELALQRGNGRMTAFRIMADAPAEDLGEAFAYSTGLHCPDSNLRYSDPAPSMFSFNSPAGACPVCKGFGRVIGVDYGLVIPNDKLTLRMGAIKPMQTPAWQECQDDLMRHAELHAVRVVPVDAKRLAGMAGGGARHQGAVARVSGESRHVTLDDVLDTLEEPAFLLVLDGIQDPHNLGACLRVADAVGAHAVIAPKDRAVGLTQTAIKVASGAADTVPYIVVTNLARSLREMQERGIWVIGAAGEAQRELYAIDQKVPCAWVLGAEGDGMRRLTRETCDALARIPMHGSVESLNVSVSAGICLFEARRQRGG